jgi:hypothetical protein
MIVLLIFICVVLIVYLILLAGRTERVRPTKMYTFVPSPASYDALHALCPDDAYVGSVDDTTYRAVAARYDDGNDTVYGYFIYHVPTMRVISECYANTAALHALERHAQYIFT